MNIYRLLTHSAAPLIPLWLHWRAFKGKEDKKRLRERFGRASVRRPKGPLLWLHAASVGEANSVLLLLQKIKSTAPGVHILMTTGTVTSARMMAQRLPQGAIHQYVPVDTPEATESFMRHWKPDFAFWVESELWPNLVAAADDYECFMGIINARMSQRSLEGWQKRPQLIRSMLECFNLIFAQSDDDADRLTTLGARDVMSLGNLKFDANLLPCDEEALITLQKQVGGRPLWLAASTHPGEEEQVLEAHKLLAATRPDLLTIIVPRHADRGSQLAQQLGEGVALRSKKQAITPATRIYIADTMGELGLFYRTTDIVFMGGSLVPHGGQNPLEPARLSCAIITGPHTQNFTTIYADMESAQLVRRAPSSAALAALVAGLLDDAPQRTTLQKSTQNWVDSKSGTAERIMQLLGPLLAPTAPTP